MFGLGAEKEEIARLKGRIAAERRALGEDFREIVPQTKRAAFVGGGAFLAKTAAPLLRPILLGLTQRAITGRGRFRLVKLLGIAALGFGAWRFFDDEA